MANYPDLKLYVAGEWRRADGQPVIKRQMNPFSAWCLTRHARTWTTRSPRRNRV